MIIFLIIIGGKKMKPSYYRISLDVHDTTSQLSFSVKKGDTSRRLLISLMDNGVPYVLTENCYAVFSARKPDKNIVFNDCTIEKNLIIYDITEQTTALEGRLDCEITLYDINGEQLTSPRFTIIVYATVFSEEEVESSGEYKSLNTLVGEANALINDVNSRLANGEFDGAAGAIVDVTATVDNNIGTPSVEVTLGGTDIERIFNLDFKNLKGDQGEKGEKGDTPEIEFDATLTEEGKVAEAKVVGDALNEYHEIHKEYVHLHKEELLQLIETLHSNYFVTADSLPTPCEETLGKIYLIPKEVNGENDDYDEYITVKSKDSYKWEHLGSTSIDLSEYAKLEALDTKVDKVTATTQFRQAYIKNIDGSQMMINIGHYNRNGAIPQYAPATSEYVGTSDDGGTFGVTMPQQPYQAANKLYVDNVADTKLDKATGATTYRQVYVKSKDGATTDMVNVGAETLVGGIVYATTVDSEYHGNYISKGSFAIADPKYPSQPTTKRYVDEAVASVSGGKLYRRELYIVQETFDEDGNYTSARQYNISSVSLSAETIVNYTDYTNNADAVRELASLVRAKYKNSLLFVGDAYQSYEHTTMLGDFSLFNTELFIGSAMGMNNWQIDITKEFTVRETITEI